MSSPDQRPSLGDSAAIDQILYELAKEVVNCRFASVNGFIAEQDANVIEEKEIEKRAWIFLSRDKNYAPLPDWNKPGVIDAHLATILALPVNGAEPVLKATLSLFVSRVREKLNLAPKQTLNEVQWKLDIQTIVVEFRNALLKPEAASATAAAVPMPTAGKNAGFDTSMHPKPSLADPLVVQKVLFGLAKEGAGARTAVAKNIIREQDARTILDKEVEKRAFIFLSRDRTFAGKPDWNKVGQIDAYIAQALGIKQAGAENTIKAALLTFLSEISERLGASPQTEAHAAAPVQWPFQKFEGAGADAIGSEFENSVQDIVVKYRDLFLGVAQVAPGSITASTIATPIEMAVPSEKKSLGEPGVIEQMLLGLARESINAHRAVTSSFISIQDAAVIEEKEIYNRVKAFLNRDPHYAVDPAWNKPGVMDVHLVKELDLSSRGAENVITEALSLFLGDVRNKLDASGNPDLTDSQWQTQIQDLVTEYAQVFLGKPASPARAAAATATPESDRVAVSKPHLNDPHAVEIILLELAGVAISARLSVGKKILSAAEADEMVNKEAAARAKIFLGQDKNYAPDPDWNVVGAVDKSFAKELGIPNDEPEETLQTGLRTFADAVCDKLHLKDGKEIPGSEWEPKVADIVTNYRNVLLGLPPETPLKAEPAKPAAAAVPVSMPKIAPAPTPTAAPAKPAAAPVKETPKTPPVSPTKEAAKAKPAEATPDWMKSEPATGPKPDWMEAKKDAKAKPEGKGKGGKAAAAAAPEPALAEKGGGSWKWIVIVLLLVIGGGGFIYVQKQAAEKKRIEEAAKQKAAEEAALQKAELEKKAVEEKKKAPRFVRVENGKIVVGSGGAADGKALGLDGGAASGTPARAIEFWYDTQVNPTTGLAQFLVASAKDKKFVSTPDCPVAWDLWYMDETGKEKEISKSAFRAKFSPDGSKLVFTDSECVLRVIDIEGKELAKTTNAYEPNWSQDGNLIVFEQAIGSPVYPPAALQLARFFWKEGKVEGILDGRFDDVGPLYHPSGKWILFVSGTRTGGASFWSVPTGGGEPRQVTNVRLDEGADYVPVPYQTTLWSADGKWFIYDVKLGKVEQTWGLEFNENGKVLRAVKLADGLQPQWSGPTTFICQKKTGNGFEMVTEKLPGT